MLSDAIECGDVRVVFQWLGDRYGHTIERSVAGEWQMVLVSIEGSPDEHWPPSPALQSLHIENRDQGPVALLVGKAGTSHWSASVESLPSVQTLQFDIACRVQQRPQRVGSSYRSADNPIHPIVPVSPPQHETTCEFVQQSEMSIWQIRPAAVNLDYPSTIRWRYRISASQCPD